jgi:hypothetical protein
MPMKASARHDKSIGRYIAFYNTRRPQGDLMQPLTDALPIRPTSTRCRSARQLNPGRRPHLATRKFCSKNRGHLTFFCHVTSKPKSRCGLVSNRAGTARKSAERLSQGRMNPKLIACARSSR